MKRYEIQKEETTLILSINMVYERI